MMSEGSEFCVVLTTTGNRAEAERLAEALVVERLAACVQIVEITSHYVWEGQARREPECLLLLKTRRSLYAQIEAWMRARHSYAVPELILLPVEAGLEAYLGWVRTQTREG